MASSRETSCWQAFNGSVFRAILSEDGKTVTNCDNPAQIYADNLAYLEGGGDPSIPWNGTTGIKTVKSCNQTFASGFGSVPLDVIAQGDEPNIFPGTVWAITYGSEGSTLGGGVTVFEPTDYDGGTGLVCDPTDDDTIDGDNDGYTNTDEIQNG
ncbi:hypothetical protein HC928_20555, partial [bacterium]|nr:hypothetical protein [bacterium]